MTAALAAALPAAEPIGRAGGEPRATVYPPAGPSPLAVAVLTDFLPWARDRVSVPDLPLTAVLTVLYRLEDLAVRHLVPEPATGPAARPALAVVPT